MIYSYKKKSQEFVGEYFKSREFDCRCDKCDYTLIDSLLIRHLDKIRIACGSPIIITSGYRCADYQKELKSKGFETAHGTSTHEKGMAADFKTKTHKGYELEIYARECGIESVGVAEDWVHVDSRTGFRKWEYKKGKL